MDGNLRRGKSELAAADVERVLPAAAYVRIQGTCSGPDTVSV